MDKEEKKKRNLEAAKRYYQRNKEAISAKRKAEYNPKKAREAWLSWYERNREREAERKRKFTQENPEVVRKYAHQRRVKLSGGLVEKYQEAEILEKYGTDCWICRVPINFSAPRSTKFIGWECGLQIDHLIPVKLGGNDSLENVRPTHGLCNKTKNAKLALSQDEIKRLREKQIAFMGG